MTHREILRRMILIGTAVGCVSAQTTNVAAQSLQCGFHSVDITPAITEQRPVWLAGYGWGRQATGVHDPLFARTVTLYDSDTKRRVAIVSVDLVGVQLPLIENVRPELPDVDLLLVTSTHNHEGPDTIGIWGQTPLRSGVDAEYLRTVEKAIVASVQQAMQNEQAVQASFGTATDDVLLGDSRLPVVKDGVLRVLQFASPSSGKVVGLIVQWNCHPEAMGPRNTLITADFCATTVADLQARFGCPVVYVTGAVGGLMAPPDGILRDEEGRELKEGDFAYAASYGRAVAKLAEKAVASARPLELTPLRYRTLPIAIPIDNPLYRAARAVGTVRRKGLIWTGDFRDVSQTLSGLAAGRYAVQSEVSVLRLGALSMAAIPGELYPELVYGQFQEPAEQHVDFPDAALETPLVKLMPTDDWMVIGLANDEIGYIIPRRQWDHQPPYAYGRSKSQYGEINSCSPDVAPIVMQAVEACVRQLEPLSNQRSPDTNLQP